MDGGVLLIIGLVVLAVVFFLLSRRTRADTGLPAGRVVYDDTDRIRPREPLFSKSMQLVGKPDYIVRQGNALIPVEVKSGSKPPRGPYDSHVYQLAAYCALVSEHYGTRPGYGIIRYRDGDYRVDYTPALERGLTQLLDEMRRDQRAPDVARSHKSKARCQSCGVQEFCDQRLL